jgi:hypothetical protein
MAITAEELCSRALLKNSLQPIQSFEEQTARAILAKELYPQTRDALLSAHPWTFAVDVKVIAQAQEAPKADFAYQHPRPANFLRALSVGSGSSTHGVRYKIQGKFILADVTPITLKHIYRPAEADWPAYFDDCLIDFLAAAFCEPLTESSSKADRLLAIAENKSLPRARLIDSQSQTPSTIAAGFLVSAHMDV